MTKHHKQRAAPRRQAEVPIDPDHPPLLCTRKQFAKLHCKLFGPISSRTLERLPVESRLIGGRAMYETRACIEWAKVRIAAAPVIAGRTAGRTRTPAPGDGEIAAHD